MKFITDTDWGMQIRAAVLTTVKNTDAALSDAIDAAISEASSYLAGKYDVAKIFAPVYLWDAALTYPLNTRLQLTAPAFAITTNYLADELVLYAGNIYTAKDDTPAAAWNINNWDFLVKDMSYFYVIVELSTAGYIPGTSIEFAAGDTRHPSMVMYIKDIALYHIHSNISPQNIPALRKERYDAAIKWLGMVAKDMLNPDLPLKDALVTSGASRFGGDTKYSVRW